MVAVLISKHALSAEERTALIQSLALLKRNALAAPFERAFALQREMEQNPVEDGVKDSRGEVMSVHYRCVDLHCPSHHRCRLPRADSLSLSPRPRARRPEEAIYLLPSSDRVTVVFSTIFKEETDRILGKVFLQEFVDARRRPSCQTAPQVLYSNREPPLEIRHLKGLDMTERAGYVTFGASASPFLLSRVRPVELTCSPTSLTVLFPRHFTPQSYASTITQIQVRRRALSRSTPSPR